MDEVVAGGRTGSGRDSTTTRLGGHTLFRTHSALLTALSWASCRRWSAMGSGQMKRWRARTARRDKSEIERGRTARAHPEAGWKDGKERRGAGPGPGTSTTPVAQEGPLVQAPPRQIARQNRARFSVKVTDAEEGRSILDAGPDGARSDARRAGLCGTERTGVTGAGGYTVQRALRRGFLTLADGCGGLPCLCSCSLRGAGAGHAVLGGIDSSGTGIPQVLSFSSITAPEAEDPLRRRSSFMIYFPRVFRIQPKPKPKRKPNAFAAACPSNYAQESSGTTCARRNPNPNRVASLRLSVVFVYGRQCPAKITRTREWSWELFKYFRSKSKLASLRFAPVPLCALLLSTHRIRLSKKLDGSGIRPN
ncbi:hypothetical protein C8R44DRAFT_744794 [Mycena epipterygia]|nr:hypothetical protein C8R44DRAFT_744794 [Mycena epipterygia]